MDDVSVNTLFKLGLVAGAAYIAYLIYQSLQAPAAAVNSAYQATTQTIADAIVAATHNAVVPQGSVLMANGSTLPVSSFANLGYDSNGILVFQYAGTNYAIAGATGSPGAYVATPYGSSTLQGLTTRRRGMR